jgi:hypothetical protein
MWQGGGAFELPLFARRLSRGYAFAKRWRGPSSEERGNMILMLLLQAATVPAAAPASAPRWTTVAKIDPATHLGSTSVSTWTADGKARLVVRCDRSAPATNAVSVQFIPKPGFARATPRPVTLTADNGPALGANWEFPGGGAYTAQDGVVTTLTVAIAHAHTIKIRAIDPTNTPIDAVFAGPGSEASIRQTVEACGQVFGQYPAPPPPTPPAPKADADQ